MQRAGMVGDYRRDALSMLSDPMAESIIGMIRDGFLADDRDRLTRILSVLEDERTKLQKR